MGEDEISQVDVIEGVEVGRRIPLPVVLSCVPAGFPSPDVASPCSRSAITRHPSPALLLARRALGRGGVGGDPALGQAGVLAEEELFHLLAQDAAGVGVGGVEAVVVDEDGHVRLPEGVALGGDVVVDALAQLAGEGRFLQARQLAAHLDALHRSRHGCSPDAWPSPPCPPLPPRWARGISPSPRARGEGLG